MSYLKPLATSPAEINTCSIAVCLSSWVWIKTWSLMTTFTPTIRGKHSLVWCSQLNLNIKNLQIRSIQLWPNGMSSIKFMFHSLIHICDHKVMISWEPHTNLSYPWVKLIDNSNEDRIWTSFFKSIWWDNWQIYILQNEVQQYLLYKTH